MKKYKELQVLLNKISSINIPVLLVLFLLIVVFSNYLLSLFGPKYSTVQIPMIILCIAYVIVALSVANARILMFIDSKILLFINMIELITLTITGVILTYYFGIIGMSISVLISASFKVGLMFFNIKKRLPIKSFGFI